MFSDEFLDQLPNDPTTAVFELAKEFLRWNSTIAPDTEVDFYEGYIEAQAALEAYVQATGFDVSMAVMTDDRRSNIKRICDGFKTIVKNLQPTIEKRLANEPLEPARARFRGKFGVAFTYEFSVSDLERIQSLINELRDQIAENEQFEPKHRRRILNKLEALQRELHRHMSSLDRLWGLIGEAGVVIGKFGTDAKPFVDRVKEIAQITWAVQARAEELPSSAALPFIVTEQQKLEDG